MAVRRFSHFVLEVLESLVRSRSSDFPRLNRERNKRKLAREHCVGLRRSWIGLEVDFFQPSCPPKKHLKLIGCDPALSGEWGLK